jgi:hypothetical protein
LLLVRRTAGRHQERTSDRVGKAAPLSQSQLDSDPIKLEANCHWDAPERRDKVTLESKQMIVSHDAELPLLRHPLGRVNAPVDHSAPSGVEPVRIGHVDNARPNQIF